MASWAGSPHGAPRKREEARGLLAFLLLCALVVAAVLGVAALVARVDRVELGATGGRSPAQPQDARAQRAGDRSSEISFRRVGAQVTVKAGRDTPALAALEGARVTVQCAFLADQGAVLTDGRVRWPRGARKVTVTLSGAPGQSAQFCSVQRSSGGSPIAQAVFPAARSEPDLPG